MMGVILFVSFVPPLGWSLERNTDASQIFSEEMNVVAKEEVEAAPYSCNFDGERKCEWTGSGEKSFTFRLHPPDPEEEAAKAKEAAAKRDAL